MVEWQDSLLGLGWEVKVNQWDNNSNVGVCSRDLLLIKEWRVVLLLLFVQIRVVEMQVLLTFQVCNNKQGGWEGED